MFTLVEQLSGLRENIINFGHSRTKSDIMVIFKKKYDPSMLDACIVITEMGKFSNAKGTNGFWNSTINGRVYAFALE